MVNFRLIFESTPTPLLVMTVGRVIVDCNRAFSDVAGRSRDELVGRPVFDAFPSTGEGRRMMEDSLERVQSTGQPDVLALVHYPIDVAGAMQERYWSCSNMPMGDGDEVAFILQSIEDVTRLHVAKAEVESSEVGSQMGTAVLQRAEQVQALNASLLAESAYLHTLFMQAPSFMCVLRGPEHRFELANSAMLALVGRDDIVGRPIRDALPEGVGQAYIDLLDTVYRSGEPFVGKQMRAEFGTGRAGAMAEAYLNFVYQPIFGDRGQVVGIFIDGNDVTDHVKAERSKAMLVRELHHRVRNTLATVQGVMNSTARTAETIEDYQWAFSGRISSLARTHSLLTEEIQQFVSFPHLLKQEVGIYSEGDASRVVLEGPDVELPSQLAVPLGMTIHELTTNAFRHGALSTPRGRVTVTWSVLPAREKRILVCRWSEAGGPPVAPPARHGFGSMILTRVLAQQIGAKVDARYNAEGFTLNAEIPLDIERI